MTRLHAYKVPEREERKLTRIIDLMTRVSKNLERTAKLLSSK